MKKKLLSILAVAAVSAIALVGCGGDDHTHKYEWKSEGNNHWQECACGDKKSSGTHEDKKINATGAEGKDELCDVCGADLHEHVYQWKSTALVHWQECACGDKKSEAAHEDEKNNETDAAGADEKCDKCGRGFYAVSFNLGGHGTALATQYIGEDGKVQEPETPDDDDSFKFKGWYKDENHETAFDFDNDTITSATEIFAWFEDDTTPGASKNHAYALVLDESNPQKAKKGEVVYYSFKATAEGRYTLSLGMGTNNENATFTTTLTGETKYGKGCDNAEVTVDVHKNETVYILFTFLGEEGNDVTVSPIVTEVKNEPMPADHFLKGEYFNATYELEITDRSDAEHQTLTFNGDPYTFRYIGGGFDRIYFTDSSFELGAITFYLSYSNGKYHFSSNDGTSTSSSSVLEYYESQDPVALNKVVGYYEPVSTSGGQATVTPKADEPDDSKNTDNATGGLIGVYVYNNTIPTATAVRYVTKTVGAKGETIVYNDVESATYNVEKNRLIFGQYVATLKLDENGDVEGLVIGGVTYARKGEAGEVPPTQVDLVENTEYTGTTYAIRTTSYGSQYFGKTGNDAIYVMSYNDTSSVYTVHVIAGSTIVEYKLTVSSDKKTISLYAEDGTTALDTLTAFEWNVNDLPTVAATDDVSADGFQKGLRLYKVQEAGWYSFTIPANATGWKNLNPNDYTDFENSVTIQSGAAVYLDADELIAVYMETPAAVSVSVARPEAPVGTSETNPKALENGTAMLEAVDVPTYYFTYTAPSAGNYLVSVVSDGYNSFLLYKVNGTQCGVDVNVYPYEYYCGATQDSPYARIEVTDENLTLNIQVTGEVGWQTVEVSVSEDYAVGASDLTLNGMPEGNSLTATTTAATGANYHIASTKGEDVTVTGSAAFTVKVQGGAIIPAEQSGETYTASIPAGKDVYFRLEADAQQTLTLTQTFSKGSEGYPTEVTITNNAGSYTVPADYGETVSAYLKLPAGAYTIEAHSEDWLTEIRIYLNGEQIWSNYEVGYPTVEIKEGDVLGVEHNDLDDLPVTFTKLSYLFTEEQAGTYAGTFEDGGYFAYIELSFNREGVGTYVAYWTDMDPNDPTPIAIVESQGIYMFTYANGESAASFTIDSNGVLRFTDSEYSVSDGVLPRKVGTAQNPKVVELTAGTATVEVPEDADYYIQLAAGNYTVSNQGYTLTVIIIHNDEEDYPQGDMINALYNITVEEGDLVLLYSMWGEEITITAVTE